MKAVLLLVCILLASSLFIPTSTMARELVEKEGPIISDSPPVIGGKVINPGKPVTGGTVNNPGKPGKECGKKPYSSCITKPPPNCKNTYNCKGHGAAP